jgi:hypothetical protein
MKLDFLKDLKNIFYDPLLIKEPFKFKVPNYLIYVGLSILTTLIIDLFLIFVLKIANVQINYRIKITDILTIVVIGPLIEEFCFRAVLKKNFKNLLYFLIGILGFVLRYLSVNPIYIIACILLLVAIVVILFNPKSQLYFLKPYKKKHLLILVYSSSLFFALSHLIGVNCFSMSFILLVIYIIPKILVGFLLAMLRIKFGLLYSIIFHVFINLIIYLITI